MKIPEALKTERAQHVFEAALVVLVIIVLPMLPLGKSGGGFAMLIASVVGLVAYFVLYHDRLRERGQTKMIAGALIIAAVVAAALALLAKGP